MAAPDRARPCIAVNRGQEPLGSVVGHGHQAASFGDPEHLARNPLRVRREHRTEDRRHHIEALVGKGKVLCVGLAPLDGQAERPAPRPAKLDHRGGEIGGHHGRTEASRRDREVAVAGGDVEHFGPRPGGGSAGRVRSRGARDARRALRSRRATTSSESHPSCSRRPPRQPPMRRRHAAPARRRRIRNPRPRWPASRSARRRTPA